jgi:polar amino acid transport system permease protein
LVRGIPILPLIFTLALVIVPDVSAKLGFANSVPQFWRAIAALSLIYGAYMAEIFRGGIQSIPTGQMEAGRSVGLSYRQTMRYIVLPQASRAIIPPLGNDFIAILKDTSLLSVLGVLELTRNARQFSAQTFKFPEAYFTLTFIYLTLVVALSLLLSQVEKYMSRDRVGER